VLAVCERHAVQQRLAQRQELLVLLRTGAACVISAVSCIAGVVWHIEVGTVQWEVVLRAAPTAVLGGFLARPIALWLGAKRLKTLDGSWIVLSALYLLWLNAR